LGVGPQIKPPTVGPYSSSLTIFFISFDCALQEHVQYPLEVHIRPEPPQEQGDFAVGFSTGISAPFFFKVNIFIKV